MSFSTSDHNVDDPADFDSKPLQVMDENFRCPICKEFYETAMILSSCSHSFCALCIRRSLNSEQKCPKCRATAYENHLIHNYDLDHVVNSWRSARQLVLTMDKPKKVEPIPDKPTKRKTKSEPIYLDADPSNDFLPVPVKPVTRRSTRLNVSSSQDTTHLSQNTNLSFEEMNTSQETINLPQETNTSQQNSIPETEELKDSSVVECPICCQSMKYKVLNTHMDGCANGDFSIPPSSPTPPPPAPPQRQKDFNYMNGSSSSSSNYPFQTKQKPIDLGRKPTRVLYAMQSDKQMRELLRELGLPEHGDRALKIWRHKEYVTLYNANYDSDSPVSANVLIQRLASIEQSQMNGKLKRKPTDSGEHKEKYKGEFDMLIERVKKQKSESESDKDKET